MMAVPGGITFPTGANDDAGEVTIEKAFQIAETEVTWELWSTVRTWALAHDPPYDIEEGRMGYVGYSTGADVETVTNQHPVCEIGWYNSVVWCNALTEMVNAETGSALTTVYRRLDNNETIRSRQDTVALYALCLAPHTGDGFRLTDNMEWELAARWRSDDDTNTVDGYSNPHFTKGDSASGAEESWLELEHTLLYAVNNQDSTAPVKSRLPNALGLYDMSGNMQEYCDGQNDWETPNVPVIRGGRWGQE
jgi:formylglycine-generating enzyme required for sulfatase activity